MSNRKIWSIPGGIHPEEHKSVSNSSEIQTALIPSRLVLPLQQHIGAIAEPIVAVGDYVLKGQIIAQSGTFVSATVHAPTSGTITAIEPRPVQHPSELDNICIELTPDNKDEWIPHEGEEAFWEIEKEQLLSTIHAAGIIGMGGAGFPSHVKLNPSKKHKIESLILNGVECEPYITADDRLMRERAYEIVHGAYIMAYLVEPTEIVIAIEANKPEAITAMQAAVTHYKDHPLQISPLLSQLKIDVVVVPTKYPSGGEKQIIQIITGKEVPSGSIPANIGVVCQNVGTAYAVSRAVQFGEPLLSRITTFTGEGFYKPGNYEVLIGTPIDEMFDQTAAREHRIQRLIMGGPMMGFTLHSSKIPIVKTTNCIIAATMDDFPEPATELPCIRCGACADACPVELLPQQLYWYAKTQNFDQAQHHNLFDCIECGACAYVCPSNISLVQYYRYAKGEIKANAVEHLKADRSRIRFEARKERLEQEQAEKEAKRKERARKAAETQKAKAALQAKAATEANLSTSTDSDSPSGTATNNDQQPLPAATQSATNAVDNATRLLQLETAVNKAEKKWKDSNKALQEKTKRNDPNLSAYQNKVSKLRAKLDDAIAALNEAKATTAAAVVVSKDEEPTASAVTSSGLTEQEIHDKTVAAAQARVLSRKLIKEIEAAEAKTTTSNGDTAGANEIEQLKSQLVAAQTEAAKLQAELDATKRERASTKHEPVKQDQAKQETLASATRDQNSELPSVTD